MPWPETVDILDASNIAEIAGDRDTYCKDPWGWRTHWFGVCNNEREKADRTLRKVLGIKKVWTKRILPENPHGKTGGSISSLLHWETFEEVTAEEKAIALNKMNELLGY